MPASIVCPNCGKRFALRPELVGKRVACKGCKEPFRVEGDAIEPEIDIAPEPEFSPAPAPAYKTRPQAGSRAAAAAPVVNYQTPAPKRTSLMEGMTDRHRFWLRGGISILIFGALALILPLFGLQFRKLSSSGMDPAALGVGLMIMGGVICAMVLGRNHLKKVLWITGGAVVVLIVGMVILLSVVNSNERARRQKDVEALMSRPPAGPPPVPAQNQKPPYEGLVEKYGVDHVIRVRYDSGQPRNPEHYKIIRATLNSAGASWTVPAPGERDVLIGAPVRSAEAFMSLLPADAEKKYDPATHTAQVRLKLPTTAPSATKPAK